MKKVLSFPMVILLALSVGFLSCDKDDDGGSRASIVGKWVDVNGGIGEYGPQEGSVIFWEFRADGTMYTNDDLIDESTYTYDSKTNELYLWGGVRKTTINWISDTEIKANIIGHLKKQ